MCVLLSLLLAFPDCVVLNRGNHEDFAICSVYGFQLEVYEKYDPLTFGLFVEVFQQLPLFALVNNEVFVVHGGLFHSEEVRLEDLERAPRTAFSLEDLADDSTDPLTDPKAHSEHFFQHLVRDALWSDPVDIPGLHPSARGTNQHTLPSTLSNLLASQELAFLSVQMW
jgi:diadenosine tetraphosphatase ApaH/serine/threonine PP2A family protein phosphatase